MMASAFRQFALEDSVYTEFMFGLQSLQQAAQHLKIQTTITHSVKTRNIGIKQTLNGKPKNRKPKKNRMTLHRQGKRDVFPIL